MLRVLDAGLSRMHELRVEADAKGDTGAVRVTLSARGERSAAGSFRPGFTPAQVDAAVAAVRQPTEKYIARSQQSLPPDPLRTLGGLLFEGLFDGRRRVLYDRCLARARDAGAGLRVRVVPRPAVRWLPWEYLYDGRRTDRSDFLALSVLTRVVRDGRPPGDPARPPDELAPPVSPPVRVLMVGADFTGKLGVADEMAKLKAVAERAKFPVVLTELVAPTADRFKAALRDESYHVLHFVGHGITDAGPGRPGGLILMPPDGRPDSTGILAPGQVVTAAELRDLLGVRTDVRLVVFDACDTDETAALVAGVVPAAVGVRGLITIRACDAFMAELYRSLLRGDPLDNAVTAARQQVDRELAGSREWGLPTLYLQTPDGEFASWSADTGGAETVGDVFERTRRKRPAERRRALRRAILERNIQAVRDQIDRAGGDPPEVLQGLLARLQSRLGPGSP